MQSKQLNSNGWISSANIKATLKGHAVRSSGGGIEIKFRNGGLTGDILNRAAVPAATMVTGLMFNKGDYIEFPDGIYAQFTGAGAVVVYYDEGGADKDVNR